MALNLLCGVAALGAFPSSAASTSSAPPSALANANPTLFRLAATGLLGIGYEVLVVRVLGQVTEDTVYTFALLLAVYLVGSAAGAACYQRWLLPRPKRERLTDVLLGSLAAACLLGTSSLWAAERVKGAALDALGGGWFAAVAVEAVPALLAFGPATLVMGALFSHLARAANAAGIGFGRALGVNTLAAATAPVLFGVVLAPALGPKWALLLVVAHRTLAAGDLQLQHDGELLDRRRARIALRDVVEKLQRPLVVLLRVGFARSCRARRAAPDWRRCVAG